VIAVPDRRWYDPVLHATLHTGQPAVDAAYRFPGGVLAIDCETPGLNTFTVNCLTAAWHDGDRVTAVLLDPRRNPGHAVVARDMIAGASRLVLHNAPFDTPILWHAGLLDEPAVRRITDTLLLARLALPDRYVSKSLTALAKRYLGIPDFADGMKLAFKAAGFPTLTAGYERMDIDSPVYRMGALADTVVTLRLLPPLLDAARSWLTDHPFITHGATTAAQADEIIATQDTVNRVMLLRSAKGLPVNLDYLDRYAERVENDRLRAVAELERAGLAGGAGKASKLIEYLDTLGELPHAWPRTATGKLSATKDLLDKLDHPLAKAQRFLADVDKISGYLAKVSHQAEVTGRCHPQVGILGASQTGRWTVSSPELHQFAADARPIITGDRLWSIDWSQIEPVMLGNMAGGTDPIIESYERGDDLYEPLMRAAGIDRTTSKVCLLASMYGMGVGKLAESIGHNRESAQQIRTQMFAAMPASARFMSRVAATAETHGKVITVAGRILPVTEGGSYQSSNHVIQGSAADQLCHTIAALDAAGLSDVVRIGMHDELVVDCDAEAAAEVERIMRQPLPALRRWSGRDAVLRTDRQEMGDAWMKV